MYFQKDLAWLASIYPHWLVNDQLPLNDLIQLLVTLHSLPH